MTTTKFKQVMNAMLLSGAALSASIFGATAAFAQEQCSAYRVVGGDSLGLIAARARVPGGYQAIFNANRNILQNPNVVSAGQVLQIPCADGSLPGSTAVVARPAAVAAPTPVTSSPARALRVVTSSGYAPFADENLEGGGALTQMVRSAISTGNPDQDFSVTFVNDWGSHLESLLPIGAMDMAFPWFKPDCTKVEFLSPASAFRCTEFNHSAPLYDAVVGFYTLKGSAYANATSYKELQGATICRPEAWFTFDLEAEQLMPPNVQLVRPVPQNGCWPLLVEGEVDIVTLDALPAEEDYREAGLQDQVTNIPDLASNQTLHVFVSKDNAFANAALPSFDAGLEKLRLSGEWFNIVRAGILEAALN